MPIISENEFLKYYDQFYSKIFNYLYHRLLHRETAEDLTANVFLNALANIRKKSPDIVSFSSWIYKIATNELYRYYKYMRIRRTAVLSDSEWETFDAAATDGNDEKSFKMDDFRAVHAAMKELKKEEADIISLHFFEHKEYSEIAEILGLKESTIRSHVHRGLEKLKKLVKI